MTNPSSDLFAIPTIGLSTEQRGRALAHLERQSGMCLGYQSNQHVPDARALSFLFAMHANNVGDPFVDGNFTVNTKAMERALLDYIAKLWRAPTPSDASNPESYWGYVLTSARHHA